jgi:tetratricopeptide (TPR) repeat protein
MNPLRLLFKLFKNKAEDSTEDNHRWLEGNNAYEAGKKHYSAKQFQNALECFDKAIECGFDLDVYSLRADCLQACGFDLDAIEDFTAAISLHPEDCNLYHSRALSRGATGDIDGAVTDLQEAVRLSKVDSALNRSYRAGAIEMGWRDGHTAIYEAALIGEQLNQTMPEEIRQRIKEKHSARRKAPSKL